MELKRNKNYKFEKKGKGNIIVVDYEKHKEMKKRHILRKKRKNR